MTRHLLKVILPTALLALLLALSCRDSVHLPPVKGPPLEIPEVGKGLGQSSHDGPLTVTHVAPRGQLSSPHTQLAVSFSKPMVALAKVEQRAANQPLTITPEVPGRQRWLGSRTVVFEPKEPLPGSTSFSVQVPAGLKALDGSTLAEGKRWTFTTPRLAVSRITPRPGSRWNTPDTRISLFFNQPVRPSAVTQHAQLEIAPDGGAGKPFHLAVEARRGRNSKHVVLRPATLLPKNARVTVQLAAELSGEEGPLAMNKRYAAAFRTYGPFRVEGLSCTKDCNPEHSVRLRFSNPVRRKDARAATRVNGRRLKPGRSTYASTTVYLGEVRARARTRYNVTVARGLRDRFGQTLEPMKGPVTFVTGDYSPMIHMPLGAHGLLEASSPKALPISFRNAVSATLLSKRIDGRELAALLTQRSFRHRDDPWLEQLKGLATKPLKVSGRRNVIQHRRVNLQRLLGRKRGILALELKRKVSQNGQQEQRDPVRALVRITDLGVTAKYSGDSALAWVTSLQSGQPVAGCEVEIWKPGGSDALWRGTTDAGGLAVAPGLRKLLGEGAKRSLIVLVRKGKDESYVLSAAARDYGYWTDQLEPAWVNSRARRSYGMLFTDRGIFRPGDTVHVKGLFRENGSRGLITPEGRKVTLLVSDSRGDKLLTLERRLSAFGSLSFDVELPAGAPLGSYGVQAQLEGGDKTYGSFRVEEYRPAEFKVAVQPERSAYVRGDTLRFTTSGDYLFGAPMNGAKLRWNVHQQSSSFRPPKHDGYAFSEEVRWWRDRSTSGVPSTAYGTDKLDRHGQHKKSLPLNPPTMTGPMTYLIESTVTDVSRQAISSRASVLLHPGEFYIGARPKETFIKAGQAMEAQLVAVTPEGKRLTGKRISGTLYRRTWHSVRKQGMGGAHYFVTRPKDTPSGSCSVTSAKQPRPCRIQVAKAGYYFLRLEGMDPRKNPIITSFGFYVAGPDYVPWRRSNDTKVELVTDRKRYKVGQVARVLVKSPFKGAHGLFTVERGGILSRRPIKLTGTSTWLTVPITRDLVPDAYVSVVLVRGRSNKLPAPKQGEEDAGRPVVKAGYVKLSIGREDRRLRVAVKPDRKEYRPGEQVAVKLQVKDAKGRPVRSELTVFAADEGVLSLIGYRNPDPMSVFYADRGLAVRTMDNRMDLISRAVFGEKGKNPGGGGAGRGESSPGGVRRNFVTTPLFNPAVVTDERGQATVSFKLPDNLTTFRIVAVAASATDLFGTSQDTIKVNKPLLLLPALPRVVRVGDTLEAGVVVHNRTGKGGQVRVSATVRGLELTGAAMSTVHVPAGGSAEARFKLAGRHPGRAVLRFDAQLDDSSDSLELKRKVTLPLVTEAVATSGSTDRAVSEGIVPAQGVRRDVGGLELALSSSALVGLRGGVEYLLDYPYECAEQTTSRLVPLVLLDELTRAFEIEDLPAERVRPLVQKLVARLASLQRWDGGFAFWPSSHNTSPWVSAYVSWGLVQARARGHKVSQRVLDKARGYLRGRLLRRVSQKDKELMRLSRSTKAYLLYVLSHFDKPAKGVQSALNTLYDQRGELPIFARALLLDSVTRLKPKQQGPMVKSLLEEITNQVHQSGKHAKVEENLGDGYAPLFHSNVRSSAMLLHALLDARPDHPLVEKLVRYLLDVRKGGRWRNTQETAYCLLALHRYYEVREHAVPDFVAEVVLGDRKLLQQPFRGRSLKVEQHRVPMKQLGQAKGALGFIKRGRGRLYYTARLRYARAQLPREPWDEGLFVERTYERVDPDGSMSALRGSANLTGKGTLKVRAGDLVRITLRVTVPQQMHYVALEDPLPAGLEPVNFKLMTASQSVQRGMQRFGFNPRHSHRSYSSRWYTPFYHQELRDDRVQLFADSVWPGVHTYVYLARATTVGRFVAAPTHVEQMYAPEVFGRTGATTFEVTEQ